MTIRKCNIEGHSNADLGECVQCLRARLAAVEKERDEFAKIAGRVIIVACVRCHEAYPQWSVLSEIACPKCKRKDLEKRLSDAEERATKARAILEGYGHEKDDGTMYHAAWVWLSHKACEEKPSVKCTAPRGAEMWQHAKGCGHPTGW